MNPPCFIHRYRLVLRGGPANARSARRVAEGFLLRAGDGFGCVHPWPELGDPTVEELLAMAGAGRSHPLLERALYCAGVDGAARREGRSLWEPGSGAIPRSHATVTGEADFPALAAAGFTAVKLKTHGDDPGITGRCAAAVAAGLRVRIDCNGSGITALRGLRPWAEHIDFIEDPEPYEALRWRAIREELGIPLALDRGTGHGGYAFRVVKPALEACGRWRVPVVFTSYMDHPVGQMFAAWEASRYPGPQREAGLVTHHLFEPDAFMAAVRGRGPQLLPPDGTGLGFDPLLDALPWQRPGGGVRHRPAATGFSAASFWRDQAPVLLTNPRAPLDDPPRDLPGDCLVFATSGSTGSPAMVCLSRASLLASAAAVNDWLGVTRRDVWLRALPVFHVGGMSIHARAFLSGSAVAVTGDDKWDPGQFVDTVEREGVTLTSLVPSQVFDLVRENRAAPSALRAVLTGGGALDAGLFAQARALGWPLLPSYGMTEASSQVATARPGTHAVLPPMELLPCWEARVRGDGRLQLRGAPLLSGRLLRTAAGWLFQPAPDESGWFTTADRVRLDGRILTPLGRGDRVFKVLGELVDPGALEAVLAEAGLPPGRGMVAALPDARAGMRPWLITDLAEPEAAALMARANRLLPPFAVLAGCRFMDLPRSPLGKIRRGEVESRL